MPPAAMNGAPFGKDACSTVEERRFQRRVKRLSERGL